jgi:F-type H+-transporting ATPase subunit b
MEFTPLFFALQIINLIAFFLILLFLFFKPVRKNIERRRNKINGDLKDAEANEQAANEARDAYEVKLRKIAEQAQSEIKAAIVEGEKQKEALLADARARADELIAEARKQVSQEKDKALEELEERLEEMVASTTIKVSGGSAEEAEKQKQLIREILKR